ncbi:hypothetical protein Syn8016DRAFT_2985 [Synechococcus sp. WH 8016]|nr:hypothetical protein Syn8016DRAFT_2985 [Synechococcus sp. WH 8016]
MNLLLAVEIILLLLLAMTAGSLPIALADITRQPKQVQLLVGLLLPVTVSPLPLKYDAGTQNNELWR